VLPVLTQSQLVVMALAVAVVTISHFIMLAMPVAVLTMSQLMAAVPVAVAMGVATLTAAATTTAPTPRMAPVAKPKVAIMIRRRSFSEAINIRMSSGATPAAQSGRHCIVPSKPNLRTNSRMAHGKHALSQASVGMVAQGCLVGGRGMTERLVSV